MRHSQHFHRRAILFGMAFILIVGMVFPAISPHSASAADEYQNVGSNDIDCGTRGKGNSGGFKIHAHKVQGLVNLPAVLVGKIDIPDGKIYGVTITKTLNKTDHGSLKIVIETPKEQAINFKALKANLIGDIPSFSGIKLVVPHHPGWIELDNVDMKVDCQTAKSINLPDAKVKTCFDNGENACGESEHKKGKMTLNSLIENKAPKGIQEDIDGFQKQIKKAKDLTKRARGLRKSIEDHNSIEDVLQAVDKAKGVEQPNALQNQANQIHDQYDKLNQQISDMDLDLANAEDILKQVENQIMHDYKRLKKLDAKNDKKKQDKNRKKSAKEAKELSKLKQKIAKEQEKKGSKNAGHKKNNKKEDQPTSTDLQKQLQKVQEDLKDTGEQVNQISDDVSKGDKSINQRRQDLYKSIQHLAKQVKVPKDGDDQDLFKDIQDTLDVAKPNEAIGKQIEQAQNQRDTLKNLQKDPKAEAEQLQKDIKQANQSAGKSTLSTDKAREIGKEKAQLKEDVKKADKKAVDLRKQDGSLIQNIDDGLNKQSGKDNLSLKKRVKLPERLAQKYDIQPLKKDKVNDYRQKLQDHVQSWQKQFDDLQKGSDKKGQLKSLHDAKDKVIDAMDDLRATIKENKDQYEGDVYQTIIDQLQTADAADDEVNEKDNDSDKNKKEAEDNDKDDNKSEPKQDSSNKR